MNSKLETTLTLLNLKHPAGEDESLQNWSNNANMKHSIEHKVTQKSSSENKSAKIFLRYKNRASDQAANYRPIILPYLFLFQYSGKSNTKQTTGPFAITYSSHK